MITFEELSTIKSMNTKEVFGSILSRAEPASMPVRRADNNITLRKNIKPLKTIPVFRCHSEAFLVYTSLNYSKRLSNGS